MPPSLKTITNHNHRASRYEKRPVFPLRTALWAAGNEKKAHFPLSAAHEGSATAVNVPVLGTPTAKMPDFAVTLTFIGTFTSPKTCTVSGLPGGVGTCYVLGLFRARSPIRNHDLTRYDPTPSPNTLWTWSNMASQHCFTVIFATFCMSRRAGAFRHRHFCQFLRLDPCWSTAPPSN